MAAEHISDSEFESKVLNSGDIVVIDFWAEWCGPCRQVGPILDELATELSGKVRIAKVNIDENPETPSKYGVRGIPTMMMFKNGELISSITGARPKPQLKEWIESNVA